MGRTVVPDVRVVVVLRALVAGAALGVGVALLWLAGQLVAELVDETRTGSSLGDSLRAVLPGGPGSAVDLLNRLWPALAGAGVALVAALGWLVAVHRGAGRLAELLTGGAAALASAPLWSPFGAAVGLGLAVAIGIVAALVARWQGYERDRPRRPLRPASSPRVG